MSRRVREIGEPVLTPEVESWGGKGTNLLELAQFNNVPGGFVVNSEAYDRFTDQQEVQNLEWVQDDGDIDLEWIQDAEDTELSEIQETTRDVFLNNQLPPGYQDEIRNVVQGYEGAMYTRSSAVNEDGEDNSGAGRLESFGPLHGAEEILDGTKKVFASAFDEKAINYLNSNDMESFGGVAVVVQEAVDPQFGGVIYSSDPNGDPDEVYMEVNHSPEDVVDDDVRDIIHVDEDDIPRGRNSGERFRYKNNEEAGGEPLPDAEQIMEAAGIAKDIEDIYDSPMDIEFAADQDGEIYVLQGRPITVEGYGEPDFDIPGEIRDISQDERLAETGIVRNSGILEETPAVVVDEATPGGEYQTEGTLNQYDDQFSEGYVVVTPHMNEEIENRTENAVGLVASEGGKTSHASTVADERGLLYMGALETQPQNQLEHGDELYMAVNGHEGVLARGGGN